MNPNRRIEGDGRAIGDMIVDSVREDVAPTIRLLAFMTGATAAVKAVDFFDHAIRSGGQKVIILLNQAYNLELEL